MPSRTTRKKRKSLTQRRQRGGSNNDGAIEMRLSTLENDLNSLKKAIGWDKKRYHPRAAGAVDMATYLSFTEAKLDNLENRVLNNNNNNND
jgi:hypothetical protein